MHRLTWLDEATPLPDVHLALPDGLLAVGGGLSVERLTEAYRKGIFPWFSPGDPVLWWSPDPRMVLHCSQFKTSRSLAKKLRQIARNEGSLQASIRVTTNLAFATVMQACAAPIGNRNATWISPSIQDAYCDWHAAGNAHSVEVWIDGGLAGGLYGVNLGRFFFGESMFSLASDTSKLALAYLVAFLQVRGIHHIDCQQETSHLASLGASPVSREHFLDLLDTALARPAPEWGSGEILQSGQLAVPPGLTP